MGILELKDSSKVPRLDFEFSSSCDHKCGHCYNVWNASEDDAQGGYPRGQLSPEDTQRMMRRAIEGSGAEHITITGGEPLLRKDALELVSLACELVPSVQIITNGSHITPEVARHFKACGLRSVQLTLLSADRERHDRLKGAECFDDTVRAAVELTTAGVPVQVCFVSMAENYHELAEVMELCYALGVRGLSYNRMSPTGWAIHEIDRLMPSVKQVEENLETAERLGRKWNIRVATAMPIPPCLIRLERFSWVTFGFCSVGTESPNITIDPLGNVRSCNLSANVMGNVLEQPWSSVYQSSYFHDFKATVPEVCKGCRYETSCQGGCKESGFATYGDLRTPEPFLAMGHPELSPSKPTTQVALSSLSISRGG